MEGRFFSSHETTHTAAVLRRRPRFIATIHFQRREIAGAIKQHATIRKRVKSSIGILPFSFC